MRLPRAGGDTDTNACIVGGMSGALWGIEGVPAAMYGPVLRFDPTAGAGRHRPAWLAAGRIPALCKGLWDKADWVSL